MILGFKEKFADGTPTHFMQKILTSVTPDGHGVCAEVPYGFTPKIHTLREGERWRAGLTIEMAYNSRSKNYHQFNRHIPLLHTCISTQDIFMIYYNKKLKIFIDAEWQHYYAKQLLVKNDGLNILQFLSFFFPKGEGEWSGQIIHWTNFKY